ncbi:hypothetical protein Barb4_00036 [Bacteroidales bacterium Barb4]|nr:hypothetical protein Barb4_00036 [Bacteroidales bacterium Barb4]
MKLDYLTSNSVILSEVGYKNTQLFYYYPFILRINTIIQVQVQWTIDEEFNAVFLEVTKTEIYEIVGGGGFARTNIVERYVGMGLSVKESVKNSSEYNIQFIYPLLGQVQGEYNFKKTGNNTMTY